MWHNVLFLDKVWIDYVPRVIDWTIASPLKVSRPTKHTAEPAATFHVMASDPPALYKRWIKKQPTTPMVSKVSLSTNATKHEYGAAQGLSPE